MFRKILIFFVVAVFLTVPLYAQEEGEIPGILQEMETVEEEAFVEPVVIAEPEALEEEGLVSLDFRDAEIQNVLRILSLKSGVNIVTGPEVTGLVTIQLKDVPWKMALEVILETYGYGYQHKGEIITVTTIENLKKRREDAQLLADQEPLVTKTVILNYAKDATIVASIEKMKTSRGSVNYDDRTNALIILDIDSNVDLMGELIEQMDVPTPQVLIEAKIVETTIADDETLGVDWLALVSAEGSARPMTWPFTTSSDNKYLPDNIPATTAGFSYGTLNFSQVSAVFQMLRMRVDTNIVSNPRIVTLDNQEAVIDVGSEYPYPLKFFNDETGTWQLSDWEYKKIGVVLKVTPHVNNSGLITLDLNPKVTEILGFREDVESGSEAPELSNEEAKTQVMIKDGDTLVSAGLIKDKVIDTEKKVPFLGSIPFLGRAFRKTEKNITKTDLLIFVTPHIVTPDSQ